ncbi:MAG: DUF5715 family protein [Candidatus Paceibacterota bacterium]
MRKIILLAGVLVICSAIAMGQSRRHRPGELVGSTEQRVIQNTKAVNLGIESVVDDKQLMSMASNGKLVRLLDTSHYYIGHSRNQKPEPVYVRPWVASYLNNLARDYFLAFRKKLKITSGTRTLERQKAMRTRGSRYYTPYAAKAETALEESLHLRGVVVDISRLGMTRREILWFRQRLVADKVNGIEAEEEQNEIEIEIEPIEENVCYHIVVFPKSSK